MTFFSILFQCLKIYKNLEKLHPTLSITLDIFLGLRLFNLPPIAKTAKDEHLERFIVENLNLAYNKNCLGKWLEEKSL